LSNARRKKKLYAACDHDLGFERADVQYATFCEVQLLNINMTYCF